MTVVINGTTGITSVNGSAAAPSVTGTDTDTGIVYGTNTVTIATGGTAGLVQNSVQGVQIANTLGVGATTPSTSGAGITFPATQSASTDANTLDDYEEGTWTPSLEGLSTAGTAVYTERGGRYIKIGTSVYIVFHIQLSSFSGASGELVIRGLPFTSGAMGSATLRNSFPMCRWANLASAATSVIAMTADSVNYLGVACCTSSTSSPYYSTVSAVTGTTILTGSGTYYAIN